MRAETAAEDCTTQAHDSGGFHSVDGVAPGRVPGAILPPPTPVVPARADCPRSTKVVLRACPGSRSSLRVGFAVAGAFSPTRVLPPCCAVACPARPLRGGRARLHASCARPPAPSLGLGARCRAPAALAASAALALALALRGRAALALAALRARAWRFAFARGGSRLSPSGFARATSSHAPCAAHSAAFLSPGAWHFFCSARLRACAVLLVRRGAVSVASPLRPPAPPSPLGTPGSTKPEGASISQTCFPAAGGIPAPRWGTSAAVDNP